jgi:hypothetical protein
MTHDGHNAAKEGECPTAGQLRLAEELTGEPGEEEYAAETFGEVEEKGEETERFANGTEDISGTDVTTAEASDIDTFGTGEEKPERQRTNEVGGDAAERPKVYDW